MQFSCVSKKANSPAKAKIMTKGNPYLAQKEEKDVQPGIAGKFYAKDGRPDMVGVESYHFEKIKTNSYISYIHDETSAQPKAPFRNLVINKPTRTITGITDFGPKGYGDYEHTLKFSKDFKTITSRQVIFKRKDWDDEWKYTGEETTEEFENDYQLMKKSEKFITYIDNTLWKSMFEYRNNHPILLCPNRLFNHQLYSGKWMSISQNNDQDMLVFVCGYPGAASEQNRKSGWPLKEICTGRFSDQ